METGRDRGAAAGGERGRQGEKGGDRGETGGDMGETEGDRGGQGETVELLQRMPASKGS